jgi:FKBP-type peptidyl-prolyl cis-trans isomerase
LTSAIQIERLKEGSGKVPQTGSKLTVHYTGWLLDGTKFDSSLDRNEPFIYTYKTDKVIKGFEMGFEEMKEGEVRKITIPPGLAYGEKGKGSIPPNSTLIFEIQLLRVQ